MTPKQRRLKRRRENLALEGVKKPKLMSRKWYVRELDKELSQQVRASNPICAFCNKPSECCFHYLTRKNYSTRWDRRNVTVSCAGCNIRYEHDVDFIHAVVDRFKWEYGNKGWDDLVRSHHEPVKFSRHDLASMLEAMKSGKDWFRLLESV